MLRDAREKSGRTQEDVAKAVSLTRTSLTNMEKGRQKLLLHTFTDIAVFLGKNPSQMLTEVLAKMEEQRPAPLIPHTVSRKTHEQISGILVSLREEHHHAKSSSKPNSRKSRVAAQ